MSEPRGVIGGDVEVDDEEGKDVGRALGPAS